MSVQSNTIYEVLRVSDGVCLFAEDHVARLFNTARLAGESLPFNESQMLKMLEQLVKENNSVAGNLKIIVDISGNQSNYFAGYIPHQYPSDEQYRDGVFLTAVMGERPSPNAKIWHSDLKKKTEEAITFKKAYEAVLVDSDGYITEGSRSNIFFVKDDIIITAPFNRVLPGVTRKYVLQTCIKSKYEIDERCIQYKELSSVQAAFITGTSPKVLPVKMIDHFTFSTENEIMKGIMNGYQEMINNYILSHS